ncbi:MAG: hypothetical protein JST04_06915 [Bdellovibrionales bacterium]|nr:hypothetical protein [Bdellovibrionales bacterium]
MESALRPVNFLHVAVLVFALGAAVAILHRRGWKLPPRVHAIAGLALLVGVYLAGGYSAERDGLFFVLLVTAAPPAIVYAFFLFNRER